MEKYQKISSESARIKKIFGVLPAENCTELKNTCVAFLEHVDVEFNKANHQSEEVAFFVYKVRNQLIHNFRRTGTGSSQLKQIISELEELVPRLIYEFGFSRQIPVVAA
ncbi:hypothetical protein [Duganella levis]|uniref:Uncharacterized protein n=1 Tax=Duganella levis TaxID=2692169 RepID=A0ABW9W4T3_9BURK|nr:hypothetical protein [Duganella levis]MYN28936.1 hypothetical protein [Duganella levis]